LIPGEQALTTPKNFITGVENALHTAAENMQTPLEQILGETKVFCFGTTVGTNAIATRSGVKTGMITTMGAKDTIYIARGMSKWSGLPEAEVKHMAMTRRPEPIVPKSLIKEIQERVDWKGSIVCKLLPDEIRDAAKSLVEQGVESIAICFLWSFQNNVHEKEAKKIISDLYPNIYTSASHEIAPLQGEYERFITTVFDCYVGPIVSKFMESLRRTLKNKGLRARLLIMKADGGSAFSDEVLPVATVHSGPAGGVIGARFLGELLGYSNIVSADVGGTTFDVSLIMDGRVSYSREPVIEKHRVLYPTVDLTSIGAGGGTIIWANPDTRTLHVGPMSAGADPGPACYGLGGTAPTLTDATLILGYLNPDYFFGGRITLDHNKAVKSLESVADQLGMDVTQVAAGAYDIINAQMSDLLTGLTVRRGYDIREFTLFIFGGAGPVHAAAIGGETGIKEIVIPTGAATYSALGLATSSLLHTHVKYAYHKLPMDMNILNQYFEELDTAVSADLERDGVKREDRTIRYFLDMKYALQIHVVRIEVTRKKYGTNESDLIASQFDTAYDDLYGKGAAYPAAGRIVTAVIVTGEGKAPEIRLVRHKLKGQDASPALKSQRNAFFRKYNEYVATNIYDYDGLQAGNIIEGPAIIEAADTTIVIPPVQNAYLDEYLNIKIKP